MVNQGRGEWDEAGWKRVGEKIVERRLSMSWKQADLVRGTKLSQPTIQDLEHGRRDTYDPVTLQIVCDTLHWTRESIQRILDGMEPEIAEGTILREDVTVQVLRRLDLAEARIRTLQRVLDVDERERDGLDEPPESPPPGH